MIRGVIPEIVEKTLEQGFKILLVLKVLENGIYKYREEMAKDMSKLVGHKVYGNQIKNQIRILKNLGYIIEAKDDRFVTPGDKGLLKFYKITDDGIYLLRRGTSYLENMVKILKFEVK